MRRPSSLPKRLWLNDACTLWATKYRDGWTVYDSERGLIGFAVTERELDRFR